jgi:signal transduction histidine kinase
MQTGFGTNHAKLLEPSNRRDARNDRSPSGQPAMLKPLRILVIEDRETDAILIVRELQRAGYQVAYERVETREAIIGALERGPWDVIIADYALPEIDAPRALALVKERRLDVPFIIVSGTIDEITAVDAMRAGAHDFIAKSSLARLLPAVEREIREAASRAEGRRMQEQLLVSDRMASLGTLAAGVAHEINNPLAAVVANLDVVLLDLDRAHGAFHAAASSERVLAGDRLAARVDESLKALRDAREAAVRVTEVSRDLKVFSRGGDGSRGPVDVQQVVESSLRIARNEIRQRARIVRDYQPVPRVDANETRLGQIFLNLILNAAQAIPEGAVGRNEIRVAIRPIGPQLVAVEVSDSGAGIPEHVLPRIFELFFTTKPVGVGTGLGLAICARLVGEIGGAIAVETLPGKGTTFRVTLPIATLPAAITVSSPPTISSPIARARILVLDDDLLVLNVAQRILSSHHEVIAFSDPREALAGIAAGAVYDLVLCDLLMPEMTGMAVYREILRIAPALAERIVFMTGGAFTPAAREFLESVRPAQLDKPFGAAALLDMVSRTLR